MNASINPVDEKNRPRDDEIGSIMTLTRESPWKSPDIFAVRPDTSEYGYLAGRKMVGCTREELIRKCSRDQVPPIQLVWTPETPRLVPPAEVSFLFDSIRARAHKRYRTVVWTSMINCFIWGGVGFLGFESGRNSVISLIPLLFFGIIPLSQGIRGLRKLRSFSPEALAGEVELIRYAAWMQTRKVTYTYGLLACIVLVVLTQLSCGLEKSITAAGLVKPDVWHGQIWRLFTCIMLHGSVLHLVFNGTALLQLGRTVEVLTHRIYLAVVFVVSGLFGSLFSLFLLPHTTSVGASGGLLGLIGFLAVLGYYHKHSLPPGFLRSIIASIALISAMGLFAYQYIDNAAHFGGLASGIALGALLIDRTDFSPVPTRKVFVVGWICLAVVLFTTLGSIYVITK
jgi:membrane associated rhomboid family serine protease